MSGQQLLCPLNLGHNIFCSGLVCYYSGTSLRAYIPQLPFSKLRTNYKPRSPLGKAFNPSRHHFVLAAVAVAGITSDGTWAVQEIYTMGRRVVGYTPLTTEFTGLDAPLKFGDSNLPCPSIKPEVFRIVWDGQWYPWRLPGCTPIWRSQVTSQNNIFVKTWHGPG